METHCPSYSCRVCAKRFSAMRLSPPYFPRTKYGILREMYFENSLRPFAGRVGPISRSALAPSQTPSAMTFSWTTTGLLLRPIPPIPT